MSYLLDTNVISQFIAKKPAETVLGWITKHRSAGLYLSSITIGEIQRGISILPVSKRQRHLSQWLHRRLLIEYDRFILPVDRHTMLVWGDLMADLKRKSHPIPIMDSLIAATTIQPTLTLVTRNVRDSQALDIPLLDPWDG